MKTDNSDGPAAESGATAADTAASTSDAGGAPAGNDAPGGGGSETPTDGRSRFERHLDNILEGGAGATAGDDDDETDDETPGRESAPDPAEGDETGEDGGQDAGGEPGKGADGMDDDDVVVLRMPGRREGEEDFELPLDAATLKAAGLDPQVVAERFAQLRNGYGYRREVEEERRAVQAEAANIEWVREEMAQRPIDFLTDHVPAELHADIVRELLARMPDDKFAELAEIVGQWDTEPAERKEARLEAREKAGERREQRAREEARARQRAEFVNAVSKQITDLAPDDLSEQEASEFYDYAAYSLQRWSQQQPKGTQLDPARVPQILKELGVLDRFGLSLPSGEPGARRTPSRPAKGARPAGRTAARPGDARQRAGNAGKELRERRERRRIAVTAPGGAAGTAGSERPPRGQTFDQRLGWLKKRLGLSR